MTIPNVVSAIRIALVPVLLWLLLGADAPAAAGWLLLGLGVTDWVDGYLARRLDQVSELGKILDPVADRLAVAAAVIGGWISGALPWPVALAIIIREGVIGAGTLILFTRRRVTLEVRWIGKAATFALYGAVSAFFVYAGDGGRFFQWAAWGAAVPGLVLYYASAVAYVGDARRALASEESVSSPPPNRGDR
jgi:cardiolipin synthase (CMP-forming)